MIGRGEVADTVCEVRQIPLSSCQPILKQFVHKFVEEFFESFVKFHTGEYLEKVLISYGKCGFPGAVDSMDCTHAI